MANRVRTRDALLPGIAGVASGLEGQLLPLGKLASALPPEGLSTVRFPLPPPMRKADPLVATTGNAHRPQPLRARPAKTFRGADHRTAAGRSTKARPSPWASRRR